MGCSAFTCHPTMTQLSKVWQPLWYLTQSWNGVKMHANRDLVIGFLKNTLRFRGFVISDWEGIDRITSPPHANYSYSIQAGINAGIDMVMLPYNYTEFIGGLTFLVKNKIIDDAVKRILRVKFVMGLFEEPLADLSLVNQLGSQEHRELAREAVRKSLVLLKNGESADKPLPPLPKKASKILVAGSHAHNLGYQCGGWTMEWQGLGGNNLTQAWLPGTEGQGVADVLFGDYGFTCKLSRTWFKTVDQLPMNVGDAHYDPLFPFGFGLTTTPTNAN